MIDKCNTFIDYQILAKLLQFIVKISEAITLSFNIF